MQRIFELYASGAHSFFDVADVLNGEGWRALNWQTKERRLFGRESVRTILANRAYLGFVSAGGQEYPGHHPPLISEDVWRLVEELRSERTRSNHMTSAESLHWLTGILWCDTCGRKIWNHRSCHLRYYRCSGCFNHTCDTRMINAERLEKDMLSVLSHLMVSTTTVEAILLETRRQIDIIEHPVMPVTDQDTVKVRLKRLARLYADGMIEDDEYARERDALTAAMAWTPTATPPQAAFNLEKAIQLISDIPSLIARATSHERRAVMRSLFERVWVKEQSLRGLVPRSEIEPLIRSIALVATIGKSVGGVADGARTRNILSHSQALRRLNYSHHVMPRKYSGEGFDCQAD